MNFVVLPAVFTQPREVQRALARLVILGPERLMIGAALAAAILGIVRGTVYGPVRSVEALGTRYGIVWAAAILVTVAVFIVGARVTSPAARGLLDDDRLWAPLPDGSPTPGLASRIARDCVASGSSSSASWASWS